MDSSIKSISSVSIHPLVLVSISDYHTRLQAMGKASGQSSMQPRHRASGALLGTRQGEGIELNHSFELKLNGDGSFDEDFATKRAAQFKEIFPELDVVGWYACDSRLHNSDMQSRQQFASIFRIKSSNPLFLLLNHAEATMASKTQNLEFLRNLPLAVYEADVMDFKSLPFTFTSTDSERIAVDHAVSAGGKGSDLITQHLNTLKRSIDMLTVRVDVIKRFVEASASGEIPWDAALLREAAQVCKELPSMKLEDYSAALSKEKDHVQVITYLSGVTKSLCTLDSIVNKFNLAYNFPLWRTSSKLRSQKHVSMPDRF